MENLSERSTTKRLRSSSASPNESKPGPRLLVVPGTLTMTLWAGVKKLSHVAPIRDDRLLLRR